MNIKIIFLLFLCSTSMACTIIPTYTESDLQTDPALLGSWYPKATTGELATARIYNFNSDHTMIREGRNDTLYYSADNGKISLYRHESSGVFTEVGGSILTYLFVGETLVFRVDAQETVLYRQ